MSEGNSSSQERWDTADWALFTETWPPGAQTLIMVRQGMVRQGMTGAELFISDRRSEGRADWTWRAGKMLKNSSKKFLWVELRSG